MSAPQCFEASGHAKRPLLKVIREKCIDCSGGSLAQVRRCPVQRCALWPYRMGRNPFSQRRGGAENFHPVLGKISEGMPS
jgi:hypothetical protein